MSLIRYPIIPEDLINICETDHERRTMCYLVNQAFVDGYRTGIANKPEDLTSRWLGDLATGSEEHTKAAYEKRDWLLDNLK